MWFRKDNRLDPVPRHRDRGYGGRPEINGVTGVALHPVGDPLNTRLLEAKLDEPVVPVDRRIPYWPTNRFVLRRSHLARNLVIEGGAPSEGYAAYNHLRTQVLKILKGNGWSTVVITSPTSAAGTTLTSINLAMSIARDLGQSVLLVELDLIRPTFRQVLGFEQSLGIVDHLLHDVPISDILLNPEIDRLIVLPAGPPVDNSSELLSSPQMVRLIADLKLRYEHHIILFDLPAVLAVDDAMAFSPLADCALLVALEGETRVDDMRRAMDYLSPTRVIGTVLNRSTTSGYGG